MFWIAKLMFWIWYAVRCVVVVLRQSNLVIVNHALVQTTYGNYFTSVLYGRTIRRCSHTHSMVCGRPCKHTLIRYALPTCPRLEMFAYHVRHASPSAYCLIHPAPATLPCSLSISSIALSARLHQSNSYAFEWWVLPPHDSSCLSRYSILQLYR